MKVFNFIVLFLFSVCILSCNKAKNAQKKLEGSWNIIEYKLTNSQGLTYYYPASGTIEFKHFSENNAEYIIDISYDNQGVPSFKKENGSIEMYDDGEFYDLLRLNGDGSITTLKEGRIVILTTNDLKTLFIDEFGNHQFILEK